MLLLQIATLLSLGFVVYQDFKYRGVYWFCFPILSILLGTLKTLDLGFYTLWTDGLMTISFLLLQILCLWCYFAMKHKKLITLTNGFIGWGDILFLFVLCFYLSPVNYILFYVFSLIAAIVFAISAKAISKKESFTIPLAGIQSFLFVLFLTGEWYLGFRTDNLLEFINL